MLCGLLLGLLEGFGHGVFELEMEWSGERERWKRMECERKGGLVVYKRDEITVFRAEKGGDIDELFVCHVQFAPLNPQCSSRTCC